MDKVKCELCPISNYCPAHQEQEKQNDLSYHPQEITRVDVDDCPLIKTIKQVAKL
jgi:adenine-specific DNA glycosylase